MHLEEEAAGKCKVEVDRARSNTSQSSSSVKTCEPSSSESSPGSSRGALDFWAQITVSGIRNEAR